MRRLIFVLACLLPPAAFAHADGEAADWWTLDPWIVGPMLLAAALYLRGILVLRMKGATRQVLRPIAMAGFCAGAGALFLALVWPLDALGEVSFAAHMGQHMMLIAVAAPLFALAQPAPVLLAALPARWRRVNASLGGLYAVLRFLARPPLAFAIHGALVWVWHAPLLFELALRWRWLHVLEHLAFFGSALLFWFAMRNAARHDGGGAAALWVLGTLMHTGLLGALITFAPRLLYAVYGKTEVSGLSPMEDQQLAGLLMWVPGSACYLAAGLWLAAAWLRASAQAAR